MQVQMPFERAKRRLSEMLEVSPRPKVVIVTMFRNPRYVRELMGLGASAYMLKSTSVEHLLAVIRGAVLHPDEENAVVNMPREAVEAERGGSGGVLTGREMEVLLLAARGLENSRIASRLRIAEGSVRRHLMNIYRKLGVNSRTEAIREALSEDWITIEDFTQEAEEEGNS